jgi:hypothetical protein
MKATTLMGLAAGMAAASTLALAAKLSEAKIGVWLPLVAGALPYVSTLDLGSLWGRPIPSGVKSKESE